MRLFLDQYKQINILEMILLTFWKIIYGKNELLLNCSTLNHHHSLLECFEDQAEISVDNYIKLMMLEVHWK